jgi:uncharacterized protein YukE
MDHRRSHVRPARRWPLLTIAFAAALAAVSAATLTTVARAQTQASPSNTSLPTISGNATVGQTLTASPGSWSGSTPISFAYQWLRCDSSGNGCSNIAGETGNNRLIVPSDAGHRLRVRVTATNSDGAVSATSNASDVIAPAGSGAPVNTKEPAISGSAVQGQTVTVSTGSWTGATPITYKYQWLRCDANAANCSDIAGETSANRTVTPDDVGRRLRARVTASNSAGSTSVLANATSVVTGSGGSGSGAPLNTAPPTISGTTTSGQTLVASNGSWTGAPTITFTYQWQRCDENANACSSIAGETKSNRLLTGDDVGHRMRILVTAKNGAGSATVQSGPTATVTAGSSGGGPLPDGAVKLPSGKYSIPVGSVSLPQQLVIDKVKFSPNPVRSRSGPITVRVHVLDTRGYVVRDAIVLVRSVPILTSTPPEQTTLNDGWATFQLLPKASFPLKRGFVQFFIRVRKPGENVLVGVGTRRLVQVRTARP